MRTARFAVASLSTIVGLATLGVCARVRQTCRRSDLVVVGSEAPVRGPSIQRGRWTCSRRLRSALEYDISLLPVVAMPDAVDGMLVTVEGAALPEDFVTAPYGVVVGAPWFDRGQSDQTLVSVTCNTAPHARLSWAMHDSARTWADLVDEAQLAQCATVELRFARQARRFLPYYVFASGISLTVVAAWTAIYWRARELQSTALLLVATVACFGMMGMAWVWLLAKPWHQILALVIGFPALCVSQLLHTLLTFQHRPKLAAAMMLLNAGLVSCVALFLCQQGSVFEWVAVVLCFVYMPAFGLQQPDKPECLMESEVELRVSEGTPEHALSP